MKRRKMLKTAVTAVGAAAVASTFPKPGLSSNHKKWRLITTWPKNLPGLGTGAQYFADQVTKCSGGRLSIQLFASGEIVPAFESIDAVGAGTVEMGHGAPYYWKGKAPASQFVSNFPFGLTAQEYNAWYYYGGGDKLCDELYQDAFGCKYIICGNTGIQHPGWCSKEVDTLEQFKGLKMRMPGIGAEVMKRIGATVVNLPGSEVAAALASGTIDWVEWNNPYGEASMGFHRHAKYYYAPGWHECGTALELFVNSKAWNSLDDELKAIVIQCANSTNVVMLSEFQGRSGPVLQDFIKNHGVKIKMLSDEVLTKLGNVAGEVISELAAADKMSGKVLKSMAKFRTEQVAYSNTMETAFLNARNLPFKFPS
ncbi:MAG: ABC transporter substrate-binding protein [Magnetovibrio sp.]|nr:ABC transporter substrate-binding protein [Magnetovibrio sp.]